VSNSLRVAIILTLLLAGMAGTPVGVRAAPDTPAIGEPAFARLWERTDRPVATSAVTRSWLWGPAPLDAVVTERYVDAPGGARRVQYFDKGRMELTNPQGDQTSPWYVTSGLLTRELISGRVQIGDATYLNGPAAEVPVAGDPTNTFPTYRDLQAIVDQSQPDRTGEAATMALLPDGPGTYDGAVQDPKARFTRYITYTGPWGTPVGYNIPVAFWEFMTQPGLVASDGGFAMADPLFDWLFVLGYPIADPFWTRVQVAGVAGYWCSPSSAACSPTRRTTQPGGRWRWGISGCTTGAGATRPRPPPRPRAISWGTAWSRVGPGPMRRRWAWTPSGGSPAPRTPSRPDRR